MNDVGALALGTVLAVGALAFVLRPLFVGPRPRRVTRLQDTRGRDDSAIRALREIEFDRATGKLSDADYAELRRTYAARAVQELRGSGAAPAGGGPASSTDDPVERRVQAWRESHRECRTCGIRPEADALYCSNCGAWLDGRCPHCGAAVTESSAGFCSRCGRALGDAAA